MELTSAAPGIGLLGPLPPSGLMAPGSSGYGVPQSSQEGMRWPSEATSGAVAPSAAKWSCYGVAGVPGRWDEVGLRRKDSVKTENLVRLVARGARGKSVFCARSPRLCDAATLLDAKGLLYHSSTSSGWSKNREKRPSLGRERAKS